MATAQITDEGLRISINRWFEVVAVDKLGERLAFYEGMSKRYKRGEYKQIVRALRELKDECS